MDKYDVPLVLANCCCIRAITHFRMCCSWKFDVIWPDVKQWILTPRTLHTGAKNMYCFATVSEESERIEKMQAVIQHLSRVGGVLMSSGTQWESSCQCNIKCGIFLTVKQNLHAICVPRQMATQSGVYHTLWRGKTRWGWVWWPNLASLRCKMKSIPTIWPLLTLTGH